MILLATSAEHPAGTPDDRLLLPALAARGLNARFARWDDPSAGWPDAAAVVVRSTWDYYRRVDAFGAWLGRLEAGGVRTFNSVETIRSNLDKRYLRELEAQGVRVVPTEWVEPNARVDLADVLARRGWSEAVAKPAVSAGAFETFRLTRATADRSQPRVDALARRGAVLIQPFVPEIASAGEWSLLYFGGRYSHAALKRPRAGDWRVQPRHGGSESAAPPPPAVRAAADALMRLLPSTPLYARVDGVVLSGAFHLMELELVEPALFLHADPDAPSRLADALVRELQ